MAAGVNTLRPVTSSDIRHSAVEFLDPENMVMAVRISLLPRLEADIQVLTVCGRHLEFTSDSIGNSAIEFLDPENMGIAVGI